MPNNHNFFTDGRLHGDHGDNSGEYQKQLAHLEEELGPIGTPVFGGPTDSVGDECEAPTTDNTFRKDLTVDEQSELNRLRGEFEPEGILGDYHADHSDSAGGYNVRFERYIQLLGIDMPSFRGPKDDQAIDIEGSIVSPSMKAHLAEIIAEERAKLSDKV